MTTDPLRAARRQAQRYWFADGLAELVLGLGFCLYAGFLAWNAYTAPRMGPWLQVLAVFALVFGTNWAVQRLKWRITYPRTGYVRYARTRQRARWAGAALGVVALVLAIAWWALQRSAWGYWLALSAGMAVLYLGLGLAQNWPRGLAYAALAVLTLPLAHWWARQGAAARAFVDQGGPWFLVLGLAQATVGGFVLRAYLRRHPQWTLEDAP